TVLVVPRDNITKIFHGDEVEPPKKPASPPKSTKAAPTESKPAFESKSDFYVTATKPALERNVRELVNLIGEAVVQVRTPGGLGSGFFINDDGFLITNFHVIEGETQISLEVYHQKDGQLERRSYKQVRIVAINKFEDLALLKIEDKDAPKFKSVSMGSADALAVG